MYKYILWDHDGVLVDTEQWYFTATQQAMAEIGIDFSQQTYLSLMANGASYWGLAEQTGISAVVIEQQRHRRNQIYQQFLQTKNIEIDGVVPVLAQLSQMHRMAIVTTSRREDFELIHRHRHITTYMDFVLTFEDYDTPKPHPAPYLTGLARFGAKAQETVVVEDTSRGLKSAVAANLNCIVIRHPFTASQDFSMAKQIIGSIQELPAILAL